ncbi:YdgH/BhsA/McbA-like domain containing protein [uncultured Pantoea sp.]|uniref:YdgH/BhsA/McbA-like domain containing protein n=1 Tax=uncultured Pantoea sp. TaxID=218084 RepID=UPI002584FA06|nr:YdgH/BhsA/McbA-like domain containing protein [uncultured Pantoea sp.]
MKMKLAIAALGLSLFSMGAGAASLVTNQEAQGLQSMNQTISISGRNGDQTHVRQVLSEKADAQGAGHYRIIENNQDNTWHITAELYK